MSKLVIIRIERGSYEQGFPVKLEIRENGKLCAAEVSGSLKPAPEIPKLYRAWQNAYYEWGTRFRWFRRNPIARGIEVPTQMDTHHSSEDITSRQAEDAAHALETALNDWLNRSSLEKIKEELLHTVNSSDRARFILQIDESQPELQQLPWELWQFLKERYDYPEVALSIRRFPRKGHLSDRVKILVILGGDEDIDLQIDWSIIKNTLAKAQIEKLEKPTASALREKLRNRAWDIIFFAGHSCTSDAGDDGRISLNNSEYLSPQQLELTLEGAVRKGLKLAIFNSCDGLGLARQLERLQIPHVIVMRQPIHDRVAQKFLKDFLESFAQGDSLHEAVREARDNLKLLENESLKAALLPVLFSNPEEEPLFFRAKNPHRRSLILKSVKASALVLLGLILGLILHRVLFPPIPPNLAFLDASLETGISLGEEILFEKNKNGNTEAGFKNFADGNYQEAKNAFKKSLELNPNQPEIRIYYNNANAANYKGEPIKIATSVPIGTNEEIGEEILRGVALAQEKINDNDGINGRLLQVVIANDNNEEKLAKKRAESFVNDNTILAVVGHNASTASKGAKDTYQTKGLVAITPTSFTETMQADTYTFSMVPSMIILAKKLADFIKENIANPKIAVCFDPDSPDNNAFKDSFLDIVDNRSQLLRIGCPLDALTFDPNSVVKRIQDENEKNQIKINAFMVTPHIDRIPKAIEVYKAVQAQKLPVQLFGSPSFHTEKTIKEGKTAVEGMVLPTPWFPKATGSYERDLYNLFGVSSNSWRTAMSYDASMIMHDGLVKALSESENPSLIRQKLDRVLRDDQFKYQGVTGITKFDPNTGKRDFNIIQDRPIIQIKNGQFVRLE